MKLQIQCAWGGLLRGALIGLALTLVSACSTTPAYPPAPATLAGVDYNYHIGASDTVNVIVWRNPELSMSVPVRPDGKITTPLIDDLPALGKTPTELARDIEKALGKYIRDPVVTVIVTELRRSGQRAGPRDRRSGEAAGRLPIAQDMTVLDVMIAVGGLTDLRTAMARGSSASPTAASSTTSGCAIF